MQSIPKINYLLLILQKDDLISQTWTAQFHLGNDSGTQCRIAFVSIVAVVPNWKQLHRSLLELPDLCLDSLDIYTVNMFFGHLSKKLASSK